MTPLILASTSPARAALLAAAGVPLRARAPMVDEDVFKSRPEARRATPAGLAPALARAKAASIVEPEALVIGADQTLSLDGVCLHKAADADAARSRLAALRGRTHHLHSAVAIARAGIVVWEQVDTARLTMRDFSDGFLDEFLARSGDTILGSVGCYRLEDGGAQLFASIDGDYFTILGLPLVPLLSALRSLEALET